jgi:hypothetical protein
MIILVCGDRKWVDKELIMEVLSQWKGKAVNIVTGAASGADALAGECARELKLSLIEVPADWKLYGRAAGPLRNKRMLALKPGLVIAFHDSLATSKGTANCVKQARALGITVRVVTHGQAKLDNFFSGTVFA